MTSDNFRLRSDLTPEERTPFVKVFGPELTDSRLSDGEKVLLWYLRFRSNSNFGPAEADGETFMSWKRIGLELGKGESTIRNQAARLKEMGLIKCESRGYGRTADKIISRPSSIYSPEVFSEKFNTLVKGKVDEAKLDVLRSVDNASDDPLRSNLSVEKNVTKTGDDRSKSSAQTARNRACRPLEIERADIDLEDSDLGDLDSATGGRDATENSGRRFRKIGHTRSGDSYDKDTGEVLDPLVLPTQDPEKFRAGKMDDRDAALDLARTSAIQVAARTARKAQEAREASQARKRQDERSGLAKERRKAREEERLANKTAGGRFYDWARLEYDRFFPEIRMTKWMKMEFSQLKKLREACHDDDELVRKSWSYLCEHWDDLTKKLKLTESAPTIGLLLAIRARIVPIVQERQTNRQYIERQSVNKKLGEW